VAVIAVLAIVGAIDKPDKPVKPKPAPTHSVVPVPVAAVTPLSQLLPPDTSSSTCKAAPKLSTPGVVADDSCDTTATAGIGYAAYQFDNAADYLAGLAYINSHLGFNAASAGTVCPPPSDGSGAEPWHSPTFPNTAGQILECFQTPSSQSLVYLWTRPTDRIVYFAGGLSNSITYAELETWWQQNG
jgi:hypothetical protein